jgi:hypothetical protein
MARGANQIIVTANPRGITGWGYIGAGITPKPGTIMQFDPTVAIKTGQHTLKLYDRDADGNRPAGPLVVLDNDGLIGRLVSTAYAAGEFVPYYIPAPGEELNVLLLDIAGEGDDHPAGELLMVDDATGKLVVSPDDQTEGANPFMLLETVTNPTADTLAWVKYAGSAG